MTFKARRYGAHYRALLLGIMSLGIGQAAAQQVFPTSVVIQNSLCVGFDCPNNPSFGSDTIILRENNLRILFDDTSTAASFPRNKWRLIANDSANGGAGHFTIQDATANRQVFRANAGARSNALVIGSNGRVGFGTATPVLVAHARLGDTPGLRLEQDGSSGFAPQTWDVAGNEANFFVRDATNGSTLPLRIRPGAPSSSIDIAANGNVGIGISSPQARLHATSSGDTALQLDTTGASGAKWSIFSQAAGGLLVVQDIVNSSSPLRIHPGAPSNALEIRINTLRFAAIPDCANGLQTNANGIVSCLVSSRKYKTVKGDLAPDVALATVMALRPKVGTFKVTPGRPEHWLIAEDVAAVDGALVGLQDGKPYTVKTHAIVADLVAVIQQQQRRIESLEQAIK